MVNRAKFRVFLIITLLCMISIWQAIMGPRGIDWDWIEKLAIGYIGFILVGLYDLGKDQ